jgi:hypothetical protein
LIARAFEKSSTVPSEAPGFAQFSLHFQSEYGPSSEAWTDRDSAVAAVSAAIAASVAGASAPPAALLLDSRFVASTADVPAPAAGVFAVLVPAARIPFPAAAGISGPASGRLCLGRWGAPRAEGLEDGWACWVEKHCCLDAVPRRSLLYVSTGKARSRSRSYDWPLLG